MQRFHMCAFLLPLSGFYFAEVQYPIWRYLLTATAALQHQVLASLELQPWQTVPAYKHATMAG